MTFLHQCLCYTRFQLKATYLWYQFSISGHLLPSFCQATLTPLSPLSPKISSSLQGQHSPFSRLQLPIMFMFISPILYTSSFKLLLTDQPKCPPKSPLLLPPTRAGPGLRPPFTVCHAAFPNGVQCQSIQSCWGWSLKRCHRLSLCLSLPLSLSDWWHMELLAEMDVQDFNNRK